jgi:hypothetical protein
MAGGLRQTHSLFSPSPLAGDLRFSDLHGENCGLLWEQGFTHVCQRFARARSTVVLVPPHSFLRHARRELGLHGAAWGGGWGVNGARWVHTAEASASLAPAPAHVHDRWAGSSGAASLTARGHARHHASHQRLRCDGLRHKASWWTTCRGSSTACGMQPPIETSNDSGQLLASTNPMDRPSRVLHLDAPEVARTVLRQPDGTIASLQERTRGVQPAQEDLARPGRQSMKAFEILPVGS